MSGPDILQVTKLHVLATLPGCAPGVGQPSGTASAPGQAVELTARELPVPTPLAAGMPNPRIAGELVLTLGTVKEHAGSPDPLARYPRPMPSVAPSCPGWPGGTVVPGGRLRKIPPGMCTFG